MRKNEMPAKVDLGERLTAVAPRSWSTMKRLFR